MTPARYGPVVIYQQREPEPAAEVDDDGGTPSIEGRAPWRPPETPLAPDGGDPTLTDEVLATARYVAVDRIDGGVTTLAVATWPTVEPATGRLQFGPRSARQVIVVDTVRLQERTDAERVTLGQLIRPVRVSDVLLVTDYAEAALDDWGRIVDMTRAGRLAAKAALYSAVAPAPTVAEAVSLGMDPIQVTQAAAGAPAAAPGDEEPAPGGPVAYPAV